LVFISQLLVFALIVCYTDSEECIDGWIHLYTQPSVEAIALPSR